MARRVFFCHQRPAGATVAAVVLAASVFLPVQAQGTSPSVGSTAQADTPVGSAPSEQCDAQAAFERQLDQRDLVPFPCTSGCPSRVMKRSSDPIPRGLPVTKSRLLSRMPSSAANNGAPLPPVATDCLNPFRMQPDGCNGIKPRNPTGRAGRSVPGASRLRQEGLWRCAPPCGLGGGGAAPARSDSCLATAPASTCAMAARGWQLATLLGDRGNCIARCNQTTRDDPRRQSQAGYQRTAEYWSRIGAHP